MRLTLINRADRRNEWLGRGGKAGGEMGEGRPTGERWNGRWILIFIINIT